MGRLMAIDYGMKRCGIAVSDPLQIIATGLTTVNTADFFTWLEKYFSQETVDVIVIGDPKRLDGSDTHATQACHTFAGNLQEKFPDKKIVRVDERFTSKMASQAIFASGVKKKDRQNKALVDEVSATILLQHFMEMPR
jgi:putative Holliday junction resolvase